VSIVDYIIQQTWRFLGDLVALSLNLSLLLPLSDNPKVDNYVIILWGLIVSRMSFGH
jgi:hypothetical protein